MIPSIEKFVSSWSRPSALLAVNLLFAIVWGFASLSKMIGGRPEWFEGKFGSTILGQFPGVAASFWLLTAAETLAFLLTLSALLRVEFLPRRQPTCLTAALVWSLFVFVMLGFGQWLTGDFNSGFQLFTYFGVTLVAVHYAQSKSGDRPSV